jgi:hypothetical protein
MSATASSEMHNMMMDDGMWGMGLMGWLVVLILLLLVAALVKYVFFK